MLDLPEETRDALYIPVAAFCTAYARRALLRAAGANRSRFVYCDTDSLHLTGTEEPQGIELHDTRLGAWKVEGEFSRARHLRAKTYIWDLNGKTSVTCAGMPSNIKAACTFDNFRIGFSNMDGNGKIIPGLGKLYPLMVKGGRTLIDRPIVLR